MVGILYASIGMLILIRVLLAFAHVTPEAMDSSMSSSALGEGLELAITQVEQTCGPCDPELLREALGKTEMRLLHKCEGYNKTVGFTVYTVLLDPDLLCLIATLGFGNNAKPDHPCKSLSIRHLYRVSILTEIP